MNTNRFPDRPLRLARRGAAALACAFLAAATGSASAAPTERVYASIVGWLSSDPAKLLEVTVNISASQQAGGSPNGYCALGGTGSAGLFTSQGAVTSMTVTKVTPTADGETVSGSITCTLAYYAIDPAKFATFDIRKAPYVIATFSADLTSTYKLGDAYGQRAMLYSGGQFSNFKIVASNGQVLLSKPVEYVKRGGAYLRKY